MVNPVIVRNPNNKWEWHVFIPGDNDGEYWTRIDMGVPQNLDGYNKHIVIRELFYGRVRPGRVIPAQPGAAHPSWTENGSWSNGEGGNAKWYYRATATDDDYVDVTIPSGYNRIALIVYDINGNGCTMSIAWDDDSTTGFDITSYDSSTKTTVTEIIIAANASHDGSKKLRITMASGTAMRLCGVRCWDTDGSGDPSTERVSGLAEGHDLVDHLKDIVANNCGLRESVSGQDTFRICSAGIGNVSPCGFAFSWRPDGEADYKFVGSGHFADGAPYTYHAGEFTNGPTIMIDGVSKDSIYDDTNNPKNTLLTGASIVLQSRGFSDYNEDTNEDADEAHLTWMHEFSPTGFGQIITVDWQDDSEVEAAYGGMITTLNKENGMVDGDYLTTLPDETKHDIYQDGSNIDVNGAESCELVLMDFPCIIYTAGCGPMQKVMYITSDKLYLMHKVATMPGGATPGASDDIWVIAFRHSIYKRRNVWPAAVRLQGELQ